MNVLEIGPGPGTFTIEASKRVGEEGKVFAIDIQPGVISRLLIVGCKGRKYKM